jgi:endoglucanase
MSRHRPRRLPYLIAAVAVACSALATAVAFARDSGSPDTTATSPTALANHFLDTYVRASGEVVRTDQGGDVVSEGEAYALLLADDTGRNDIARSVWQWTSAHLQRPDGLVSWHADGTGHVLDPQSASDADVLLAYGLLNYKGPDRTTLTTAGTRLAGAVLAHETTTVGGVVTLVAGPWATGSATVDPSYWMPSVFRALATATHDSRWQALADGSVRLLDQLTQHGSTLPPDWAHVVAGKLTAMGAPGTSDQPRYSLDAARVPVWLAIDCSSSGGPGLAAKWWSRLRTDPAALARSLDGAVVDGTQVPLPQVAAAAAAHAAGNDAATRTNLAAADKLAAANPTYYGDAWAALGAELLTAPAPTC